MAPSTRAILLGDLGLGEEPKRPRPSSSESESTLHPYISTNSQRVLHLQIVNDDAVEPKSRIRSKIPIPMYGRALLTFHHILSSRKKDAIRSVAKELDIVGICKVGYPGVLAVEGEDICVKRYVREIKSLRWQSCSLASMTSGLRLEDLHMSMGDAPRDIRMTEKMSEVSQFMREAGLEEWWRKAMRYSKGSGSGPT